MIIAMNLFTGRAPRRFNLASRPEAGQTAEAHPGVRSADDDDPRAAIASRVSSPARRRRSLRLIAVFEAAKGALVLVAGFGLAAYLQSHTRQAVEDLVTHLHLNPASGTPRVFLDAADALTDARLWMLAAGASLYAAIRFAEAYGLWRDRAWAEWLAVVSGGIYLPFEVNALLHDASPLHAGLLVGNIVIVAVLARRLWARRREKVGGVP